MTTRRTDLNACLAAALAGAVLFGGCSKPPPPPPPAPKKVEAPPPPEPVRVDSLLQTMKADARVQFASSAAPTDETLARAIISFADALARGDADKFKSMLDPGGKAVLDKLVAAGQWEESTGKSVEAVRVAKFTQSGDSGVVMLAIQEPRGAYPLSWAVAKAAGTVVFTAMPTPSVVRPRASEFDTLAISAGIDTPAAPDAGAPSSGKPESLSADAPKKDAAPTPGDDGTKVRKTPNGPVNIPNPGGKPGGG